MGSTNRRIWSPEGSTFRNNRISNTQRHGGTQASGRSNLARPYSSMPEHMSMSILRRRESTCSSVCAAMLRLSRDWMTSTPLQKRLVTEAWDLQAARAGWGTINDGRAALSRLAGGSPTDYFAKGSTTATASASKTTTTLRKGDLCPLKADQVSLPAPGTRGRWLPRRTTLAFS